MKGDLFYKDKHLCEVCKVQKELIHVGQVEVHEVLGGDALSHDPSYTRFTFQAPRDIQIPRGERAILRMEGRSFSIAIKDVTTKTTTVMVLAHGSSNSWGDSTAP